MTKHTLTRADRQRGGWTRARQHAEWRKTHPSANEDQARKACQKIGLDFEPEREFINLVGRPQFFDIWVKETSSRPGFAIEVDGSNGWHGEYDSSKMYQYDLWKKEYCEANGIIILQLGNWSGAYYWGILDMLRQIEGVPVNSELTSVTESV